ncbi:MAG: sn-glycerol-3-phosphate ABC transporter ATP-binding protein UgpC [Pseudomonadota bacterium]
MSELTLHQVKKTFGSVGVIHGIDLNIKSGEFCVFVGPSGCGKSTLLRLISGLESTTSGEIAIDGEVVNHIPAAQRGLAMVFQSYALYPHMSVRQNLSFGLENLNMPKSEIEQRVKQAAEMLQIDALMNRKPGQLSGGQRQRVAIGRAVVREPKIFLFDEPLSNLDAELRVAMRREIALLHQRLGNTMIYVTHDQVEAMTMADKIVVLRDGIIEQVGTPLDLFNHPENRFVAGFIGSPSMNFLTADIRAKGIEIDGQKIISLKKMGLPDNVDGPVELGIRPGDISLDKTDGLRLRTSSVEQLGSESYVFGNLADGQKLVIHLAGQTDFARGEDIFVNFKPEGIKLFSKTNGKVIRTE